MKTLPDDLRTMTIDSLLQVRHLKSVLVMIKADSSETYLWKRNTSRRTRASCELNNKDRISPSRLLFYSVMSSVSLYLYTFLDAGGRPAKLCSSSAFWRLHSLAVTFSKFEMWSGKRASGWQTCDCRILYISKHTIPDSLILRVINLCSSNLWI